MSYFTEYLAKKKKTITGRNRNQMNSINNKSNIVSIQFTKCKLYPEAINSDRVVSITTVNCRYKKHFYSLLS